MPLPAQLPADVPFVRSGKGKLRGRRGAIIDKLPNDILVRNQCLAEERRMVLSALDRALASLSNRCGSFATHYRNFSSFRPIGRKLPRAFGRLQGDEVGTGK
jgi:hypothetical protein